MWMYKVDVDNVVVLVVGGIGVDFYKKNGLNVVYEYCGVFDVLIFKEVCEIVKIVILMYYNEVFDEFYVFYNYFINWFFFGFWVVKMLLIFEEIFE